MHHHSSMAAFQQSAAALQLMLQVYSSNPIQRVEDVPRASTENLNNTFAKLIRNQHAKAWACVARGQPVTAEGNLVATVLLPLCRA